MLSEEDEEASLVEGVYTKVASLLGSTGSTFLFVEEGETNIGVVGLVYVTETGWEGAGEVKEGSSGRLGVAVSNAEREWAPVTVGAVLEKDAAVKRTDGNDKSSSEPSAGRSNGDNGKKLEDTVRKAYGSLVGNTWVSELPTLGSSDGASFVGNKGAVSIFLHQIDKVVVDKILDDDTGRVNNEGVVKIGVIVETAWG